MIFWFWRGITPVYHLPLHTYQIFFDCGHFIGDTADMPLQRLCEFCSHDPVNATALFEAQAVGLDIQVFNSSKCKHITILIYLAFSVPNLHLSTHLMQPPVSHRCFPTPWRYHLFTHLSTNDKMMVPQSNTLSL